MNIYSFIYKYAEQGMRCQERSSRRRPLRGHELCRYVRKIPHGSRSAQGVSRDAPLSGNALQSN